MCTSRQVKPLQSNFSSAIFQNVATHNIITEEGRMGILQVLIPIYQSADEGQANTPSQEVISAVNMGASNCQTGTVFSKVPDCQGYIPAMQHRICVCSDISRHLELLWGESPATKMAVQLATLSSSAARPYRA